MLAASTGTVPTAFVGLGVVLLVLAVLAAIADRLSLTAIPLFLVAGLAVGDGGLVHLDIDTDLVATASEIGVLLLLLTLGLEYTPRELATGMRATWVPGVLDAIVGFGPGFAIGLVMGWEVKAAILLGGVCWVSSSGVVAKVLADLGRLGNRETPSVLNLLVFEDLAMAVYLPVIAALLTDGTVAATLATVAVALAAVGGIFLLTLRFGDRLSRALTSMSDEALLLATLGLTLLVGGIAFRLQVSAAIGAFLVGLALSGPVQHRAAELVAPLRDLFAAAFFVFFAYQVDPSDLPAIAGWAALLAVVTGASKVAVGWYAAARDGIAVLGRLRAGTVLVARGEFSIVIAALGATLADGEQLGSLAAGYVLLTAIVGPIATRHSDRVARWWLARRTVAVATGPGPAPAP